MTTAPSTQADFEQAIAAVKARTERPDNMTLLRLYALYKQGTDGDASGERPGAFDMVNRAKWDAWAAQKGKSAEAAQREYIDLVASLD